MTRCPDCQPDDVRASADSGTPHVVSRRQFVKAVGGVAAAATFGPTWLRAESGSTAPSETLVQKLYQTITPEQKSAICFPWDHQDERGLLRLHVSNNWSITKPTVSSKFFSKEQQDIIEAIYWGLYNPDWKDRVKKQLDDDAGGYGQAQSIAIFGEPGTGKFEFVMTGRHLTIRCDGDSTENFAFGGPIFYGHDPGEFNEEPNHPGNVYWEQALKANELYKMLDGKQQQMALVPQAPRESMVHFRGAAKKEGIPVTELSADQKEFARSILANLLEPYRAADQAEARKCLEAQGGLDACTLAFYQSGDLGDDKVWDNWRLEGPSFVWHYRGAPHVHVWVNVANSADPKITTRG